MEWTKQQIIFLMFDDWMVEKWKWILSIVHFQLFEQCQHRTYYFWFPLDRIHPSRLHVWLKRHLRLKTACVFYSLPLKKHFPSLCLPAGVHGGCQVSRAVHLLGVGVCPGLSGSAPLPGARGDPDRWKRSAPRILCARRCTSQNITLSLPGFDPRVCLVAPMQVKSCISSY